MLPSISSESSLLRNVKISTNRDLVGFSVKAVMATSMWGTSSLTPKWYDLVVRHLRIASALLRFYIRAIPPDWYRKPPFLPVPPKDYLRWRLRTAYGHRRPPLRTLIHDLWQFGDWLRTFPG